MRILVTGAAGTIGRDVVAELDADHELRLLDRRGGDPRISVDLARPIRDAAFRDVDVVIHLAANPDEHASWEAVLNDNVRATWHVLEAAASFPRLLMHGRRQPHGDDCDAAAMTLAAPDADKVLEEGGRDRVLYKDRRYPTTASSRPDLHAEARRATDGSCRLVNGAAPGRAAGPASPPHDGVPCEAL